LTGWKIARPRSRAPPERRRAAWRLVLCAARFVASACVLARFPLPRRHESSVPFAPATSERVPSPWNASHVVRLPSTVQRSVARPPAERAYRGRRRAGELRRRVPSLWGQGAGQLFRPTQPAAMRRPTSRPPSVSQRRASIIRPNHHRPSVLASPHDTTPPPRAVDATTSASPPPEQELQRRVPPATAASRRRAPPYPICEHKSVVGEPLSTPPPFPGRAEPSPRRN
jgi:hypothetical protein